MRVLLLTLCLLASFSTADMHDGERLYREAGGYGCAVCHGSVAEGAGQAGGNIRGATLGQLNESLTSNLPMQPLATVLSDQDREDLVAYLNALGQRSLLTARYEANEWTATLTGHEPGNEIDVVLYNATFEQVSISLSLLSKDPIRIEPLATFVWHGTLKNPTEALTPISVKTTSE
jgi:cytochrome c553